MNPPLTSLPDHLPPGPTAGPTSDATSRTTGDTGAGEADDLDGTWGAPGGITTGDLATVAAVHLPRLLALAAVLTGDSRSAGDVVTAVLARLPAAGAAPVARPDLRLRRLLVREHRRRRHRRSRQPRTTTPATTPRPSRGRRTAADPLWAAMDDLPRRARTVLVLRYHQHLSDEDIASVVGRRPAIVRAHAARGLTALRTTTTGTTDAPAPAPTTEEPQ